MLSKSFDTPTNNAVEDASTEVERLVDIAEELFSAIEQQIHRIEHELVFAVLEEVPANAQALFKERLRRCAQGLELAIRDIGGYVDQRANQHIAKFGLRDN
jgi:hypothetical protein